MKLIITLCLIPLASLFNSVVVADDEFSIDSNVTLASMYLFRGFDMSMEDPALQGDFIVSHESGFWIGAWSSMYDFGKEDGIEVDFIGGYDFALTDDLTMGVGFTEYTYTGETDSSTEYYVSVSFKNFTIAYYDDVDLDTTYISVDYEIAINNKYSLTLHAADYKTAYNSAIGISYKINNNFSAFASYNNSDINNVSDKNYFVFGATYNF
ncbi:MAG: hypothetical protein GY808_18350 [Gammaproteobacteria bacterium]|nr:hypothetical protein [Gammaproteobacteria bacterium]